MDFNTILLCPSGVEKTNGNLTPWIKSLFFAHTYYVYIYTFYLFILAFYKSYALEFDNLRKTAELLGIMCIPALQHVRFYFGYWGCELSTYSDITTFIFMCSFVMLVLMYFCFKQAYVMPLDSDLLCIGIGLVIVEGICGIVNSLQVLKSKSLSCCQTILLSISIIMLISIIIFFILQYLSVEMV